MVDDVNGTTGERPWGVYGPNVYVAPGQWRPQMGS
jgi:hypothetical protein